LNQPLNLPLGHPLNQPLEAVNTAKQDQALHLLQTVFGYPAFRTQQGQIVDHVVNGGDALVLMPTGGGKSLCYQIPALIRHGVGIVVSPLIALMQDQVDALAEVGVRAAFLNSTQTFDEALNIERLMRAGEIDMVYIAPERLMTQRCLELLSVTPLAYLPSMKHTAYHNGGTTSGLNTSNFQSYMNVFPMCRASP
jgi:ATP-dependent DNA helicase RecQ